MKLKRMLVIAATLVLVMAIAVIPALAASGINENEQAVYDKLAGGVQVGSVTVNVFEDRLTEVSNYFNADGVDMTAEQKDQVIALLNDAWALASNKSVIAWANAGRSSLAELPRDVKEVLIAKGTAACAVMGLTLVYNAANNNVTITDANGNVVSECKAVVKQTGAVDYTALIVVAIALVAVLAAATVIAMRKRANAAA